MRYLIIKNDGVPYYTNWYDHENNYEEGMIVFDLYNHVYTTDGVNYNEIIFDNL